MSPSIFKYNLANFQIPPPNIKLIKYADDITIYTSEPLVADLINDLNIYLSQVLNYILFSFSLQRLNCILDHCTYVHGLALLLLC